MKILFLSLLFLFSYSAPPDFVAVGDEIESIDSNEYELQLINTVSNQNFELIYIQLDSANTGTIQFAVSRTGNFNVINSSKYAWPKNSRIPLTIVNGSYNLYYKASGAGQKFVITQ